MNFNASYRLILFLSSFIFASANVDAQEFKKNGILFETQGSFSLHSLKYERSILDMEKIRVNVTLGISHTGPFYSIFPQKLIGVPGGINVLLGKKNSRLEIGLNIWWTKAINTQFVFYENIGQLMIGYRYQNYEKFGPTIRVGIAPSYVEGFDYDISYTDYLLSSYFSIGMAF